MKKIYYVLLVAISVIALAGCNTSENNASNGSTSTNTPAPQNNNNSSETTAGEKEPSNSNNAQENPSGTEENAISYMSNGKEVTADITTQESDNQNFTISLLPDFKLSAEEPGKDVVLYDKNDKVFMRIELVPVADSSYDTMLQSTKDFMAASSSNGETKEDQAITALAPTSAKNVAAFSNDNGQETTTALLFETNNSFVRLTVFDTKEADLTEALLKMGATVTTK